MVKTQYYNGKEWIDTGDEWPRMELAWMQLGGDNYNHRVIDEDGKVLIENSQFNQIKQ